MGWFSSGDKLNNEAERERIPTFIPTTCIGEACPNYSGELCETPEMERMLAVGNTEGQDTSKAPFKEDTTYAIYGQRCFEGKEPQLVAQRVEIYKPELVNMMAIIGLTGAYGDMPVHIVDNATVARIETIASSDEPEQR